MSRLRYPIWYLMLIVGLAALGLMMIPKPIPKKITLNIVFGLYGFLFPLVTARAYRRLVGPPKTPRSYAVAFLVMMPLAILVFIALAYLQFRYPKLLVIELTR